MVPPKGYFPALKKVLDKYDILFWADEVICGFGRTGNDFGCTTMEIKPDSDEPREAAFVSVYTN